MNLKEKQQLIQKYLDENDISIVENTLEFVGVRENCEIEKNEPKDYEYFSFEVSLDEQNQYSTNTYFIYFEKKGSVAYLIGPAIMKKILFED